MIKINNYRWWIAVMLMLATALNYLDRQNLPMVVTELRKVFPIDNVAFGRLNFMFLFAYGLMYIGGGKIIDWLGPKGGLVLMVIWWSVANMMHGLVAGVMGLFIARFLLGLGEGGGFPGSAKAVSEWFPPKERSFAFGLFNTGSSIGAMIAPPLIAFIVVTLSWRWVFILTGLIGFIWALIWYFMYDHPNKSRVITSKEKILINSAINSGSENDIGKTNIKWISLFYHRQLWGLCTARLFIDSAWYFFIFWLPKYLADSRGLNIQDIGYFAWIPYACAGAGSLLGGWFSSYLIKKNISISNSRKITLGIAAAMMPVSLLITSSPLAWAIVFFGMAMFGHQCFSTLVQTIVTDIFPRQVVGSVAGLVGGIGCFGAMLFSLLAGQMVQQVGYPPVFLLVGLMHPIGFVLILLMVGKIGQVKTIG
jgi:ACS family hexuronate transporter-like MFS transporter